jgi:phage pi2 protein 07
LISALTGIPKDKIDLDKKEKNQAKAKDDDRHKKDTGSISKLSKQQVEDIWKARPDVQQNVHAKKGGDPYEKTQKWWDKYGQKEMKDFFTTASAPISPQSSSPSKNPVAKLTRAQAEEIWKARPDVEQNVHAKKKGDPYEKTQTWWEKYGQKEMSSYQFAGTTPTTPTTPPTPIASSPAPSPSPTALKPIKKLSKAQVEEIWKARPDVNENVHAKKKGDPYEKTQTWWEKTGQKEMGNYQFAGTSATPATSPPAAPAVTPPTAPSSKAPDAKVSTEIDEKRRKQEKSRAEQERQKQAKLEELRRRDEAKRLQEARKREEQTKTEEKLKATQEERKRQETQRRAEQERQRQAMADEQRRREEQQRQAQMEQQRRAEEQRRRVEQEHQRAQQEQIRRQQEQQQRARMEQQSRIQAEQQLRLQQEEARRRQTQMQQQRIHQSQPPPPSKQQQQQQKQKPTGQQ